MIGSGPRGRALVYRGPASTPGCPEAVAGVLRASSWDLDVSFVGPREDSALDAATLARAALYAQPGGGGLQAAYRRLRKQAAPIRDFVRSGGRYLGFCLGGYLAGETPGFGLLPGDTDQYVDTPDADIRTVDSTVVEVDWSGQRRRLYFQDGPNFLLEPRRGSATVVARYANGAAAAVVAPYGNGAVAVCGPHPEATADWFLDEGLPVPRPLALDLALDLVDRVMRT